MRALTIVLTFYLVTALTAADIPENATSTDRSPEFLSAQPVERFSLPRFDPAGRKIWEMRGRTAVLTGPQTIQIEELVIQIDNPAENAPTLIQSPSALLSLDDRRAHGDGFITIDGPGFTVDGNRWSWDGNSRTVRITDHAVVRLTGSLGGFLR